MIVIREADKKDIDSVNYVLRNSWRAAYRGIVSDDYLDGLAMDHWCEFLEKGLREHSIFVLVLERGDQIIGAAVLSPAAREGAVCLLSFYLLPEETGKGLGHMFYQGIEAESVKRGYTDCVLDVLQDNQRAVGFYCSHGFRATGRTTDAVLGNRTYTCDILEKALAGSALTPI